MESPVRNGRAYLFKGYCNANSYKRAQHQGGANLDELIYEVTDGLISGYEPNKSFATKISYGPLTEEQIDLLDQVAN